MIELPSEIEQLPVEKLIPYARNSRTHDDAQVAQIAASMQLVGAGEWVFCHENDCYVANMDGDIYRVCRRQKSKSGRIISEYETVRILGSIDKYGYRTVRMIVDGKRKHVKLHRLVLGAWTEPMPNLCVNHIDGNKLNNRIDNLEWVTVAQNNAHSIMTGLLDPRKGGEKNAKIGRHDYVVIHAIHRFAGVKRVDIAKANNVSRQTIDSIISRVESVIRLVGEYAKNAA